ncbi:MAG: alcohol dehydrogenase catalytic domain-containing protein [Rothia sp. (in: high G+C Gram-positive bacteria)]|uniref:zinc-binding dehydrogenase n=1 Tax=Rothia sp. (in: high G+C Gram-positive bacteria) TaxID=1885016 RepID=UPI0026E10340|nr:zinc-binding dehydrogenase [Rothia sp. (in: high G+C Gram-positive bacteria)]MDO5750613.1 alcohol dehydrogenase catalytic domain-containing protein [Rothia sp. (in: high G+C Gram-positive bacteria)]
MRAVFMNAPGEVTVEEVARPEIKESTDAIIKLAATCICGSDLWPYRGLQPVQHHSGMGHEYIGEVVEIGSDVKSVQPGDFVVGSFCISCGECETCRSGYPSRCERATFVGAGNETGTQAEYARIAWADGTLVKTPAQPTEEQLPHLLAASDVLGTGWYAADAAGAAPGKSIVVVGDGAVGLGAVIGAKQLGAEKIIVMSRNPERQALAREFGATHIVAERGEEGIAKVLELTDGKGADGVAEAVGTQQSFDQALGCVRPAGRIGSVGVPHGVSVDLGALFGKQVRLEGGPAPVRRYLPKLIELIYAGEIAPGKVFDKVLPIEQAAEGYKAMDERVATKVMLTF